MISTINENWVNDAGVKKYFTDKYDKRVNYPLRNNTTINSLPQTIDQVSDGKHSTQICHNENGIDAAHNLFYAIYNNGTESSYHWITEAGYKITPNDVLTVNASEKISLSIRNAIPHNIKGITYKLNEKYLTEVVAKIVLWQ